MSITYPLLGFLYSIENVESRPYYVGSHKDLYTFMKHYASKALYNKKRVILTDVTRDCVYFLIEEGKVLWASGFDIDMAAKVLKDINK